MQTSLLFNVVTLLQEPVGSTREYEIDDSVPLDGTAQDVRGHVRFDRTPRGILVRARLRGVASGECSRCLRATSALVDLTIEEEFIPTIDIATGVRVEAPDGEPDLYRINTHHELDLREPIAQYWAMALPMAPLCRADCRGLCASCGAELEADHVCSEQPVDPRWSKLAKLRED
jgi:uncharacterized protein